MQTVVSTLTVPAMSSSSASGGFAVTTDDNRVLYIRVNIGDTTITVSALLFDGVAPTLVGSVTGAAGKIYVYRVIAPTSGTRTWSMTLSGSADFVLCFVQWANVDQTTPDHGFTTASGNSTTPSVTVPSCITRDVVSDAVNAQGNPTATHGAGQTDVYNLVSGTSTPVTSRIRVAGSTKPGAVGNVTLTWTLNSSGKWCQASWAVRRADLSVVGAANAKASDTAKMAEIHAAKGSANGLSSDYGRAPADVLCVGSATGVSAATGFPFFRIIPVTLEVEAPQTQGFQTKEHEVQFQYQLLTGNIAGSPPLNTTGWSAVLQIGGQPDRVLTNTDPANGVWRYFTISGEFAPGIYAAVIRFTMPDGTVFNSPPFLVRPYG
jgi:hypothetical protein